MEWSEAEDAELVRRRPALPTEPLGDQLKCIFQLMTAGPMPDHLTELADRLELALQRGELKRSCVHKFKA